MILFNAGSKDSPDEIQPAVEKTYIERDGLKPYSKAVSRERAMTYSPFARCINLISRQAADMITSTIHVTDRENKIVTTEPARRACRLLMESPDDMQSAHRFLFEIFSDMLIHGNALIYMRKGMQIGGRMPVMSLERLIPDRAEAVITDPKRGISSLVYWATPFGGETEMAYPGMDIIHLILTAREGEVYNTYSDQYFAESALVHLRRQLNIGLTLDLWILDFFNNASKSNLAIEFPDRHDPKNIKAFRVNFKKHQQDDRTPLVLFGGATAKNLKANPTDAEALDLRSDNVKDIARYYGVPAPLIGINETQWGSGLESLARQFYRFGTRLYVEAVLKDLSFKLLPRGNKFEVDANSELKGDTKAMTAFLSAVRPTTNNPGLLSQAEARAVLGYHTPYDDDWEFASTMDADNNPDFQKSDGDEDDEDDEDDENEEDEV